MTKPFCVNCISASGADGAGDQLQRHDELSATSCRVANVDKKTDIDVDELSLKMRDAKEAGVDEDEEKIPDWIRCSPADLYFRRDSVTLAYCHVIGVNLNPGLL